MKRWVLCLWIALGAWSCRAVDDPKPVLDETELACEDLAGQVDQVTDEYSRGEFGKAEMTRSLNEIEAKAAEGCPEAMGLVRNGFGVQEGNRGAFFQALEFYDEASAFYGQRKTRLTPDQQIRRLELEQNRATAFFHLGWFEHAEVMLKEVLKQWQEMENREGIGEVQMLLARLFRLTGNPVPAARALDQSLAHREFLSSETLASIHQERSRLHQEAGDLQEASLALDQAVGALPSGSAHLPILLMDQAELLQDLGKWAESEALMDQLRQEESRWTKEEYFEAHLLWLESRALWEAGRRQEALAAADGSLKLMDGKRHSWQGAGADFVALRRYLERHRFELELQHHGPSRALEVFEWRKARGLLDNLWRRTLETSDFEAGVGESCSPAEAAWQLDQEPDSARYARAAGRRALLQCARRNRMDQVDVGPSQSNQPTWSLNDLGRELGSSPLLALTMGSQGLYGIWWVPGGETVAYEIDLPLSELKNLVDLPTLIRKLESAEAGEVLGRLGEHVLGPILDSLQDYPSLWVVGDGPMDGFPVDLLTRQDTGRPLFTTHAVSYLPSLTTLASIRALDQDASANGALLIGDPIYSSRDPRWPDGLTGPRGDRDSAKFRPLPKSAEEVRAVVRLHRDRDRPVTELTERRAVRSLLIETAPKYRVLHLATHAVSDAEIPERSRILLSCLDPQGQRVGRCDLYLNEISDLRLQGQLVILSACESHVGRLRDGEGPLGLSRAFLQAGAGAVVAGIWKVPDGGTARLMCRFHELLVEGETVAEALRRAKVELMGNGESAAVWAGFVVYGDGQAVL